MATKEPLLYYFGDDEAYFRTLQGEFKKHTKLDFKCERHYSSQESEIQAFFNLIFKNQPKVIFIDFSKQTQEYLHLARLVARTKFEAPIISVGMLDYLSPKDVLFESVATGINLSHIKSAEVYEVVYNVALLIAKDAIPAHGFATADPKESWVAGAITKIGFIHKTGIHFETDFSLTKGDRILLDHFWSKDKLIPSKEMFITNVTTKNLYYQFTKAVDAEFVVVDEFIPPEGMSPEEVGEKNSEREELIRRHKKKFASWIDDNLDRSFEKRTKFLVIDQEFLFYQGQKRTDKFHYIIRCVQHLPNLADDLNRFSPHIIAVAMQAADVADAVITYDFLEKLILTVKRDHADKTPFIIVFNTKISTQEMRRQLQYEHMMTSDGILEPEVLIRMADKLDEKYVAAAKFERHEQIYIKKSNPASHALIEFPVNVTKISECDMTFTCEHELPMGLNLHFASPVPFYVSVLPASGKGNKAEYTGLIHCIGELDKKELRVYINKIFFRDHDAAALAELAEFQNLNESKLKEKLEAIRIAQEKALAESEAKEVADAEDFDKPKS